MCVDNGNDYSLLDKVSASHQVFLLGETHNIACNPELTANLFEYLNSKNKLRNLIIEFGYAEALLYNQYLITGDSTLSEGTLYNNYEEYKNFWKKLYKFNQKQSNAEKVKIIGIDFERLEISEIEKIKQLSLNPCNIQLIALNKHLIKIICIFCFFVILSKAKNLM